MSEYPIRLHPIAKLIEHHTSQAQLTTTSEEYMFHAEVINVLYSLLHKIPCPSCHTNSTIPWSLSAKKYYSYPSTTLEQQ
jgi:hypothetical protein